MTRQRFIANQSGTKCVVILDNSVLEPSHAPEHDYDYDHRHDHDHAELVRYDWQDFV